MDTDLTVTIDMTTQDNTVALAPAQLTLGSAPEEQALEIGLGNVSSRWCRVKITAATLDERFGLNRMIITGFPEPLDPKIK